MINGIRNLILIASLSVVSAGCSTASISEDRELVSRQVYQQLESITSDSLRGMQEKKLEDGRRILYDGGVQLIERSSIDGRKNFGAFAGVGRYLEFDERGKLSIIILLNGEERRNLGEWECHKCKWKGRNIDEKELNEDEFMEYVDRKGIN